MSRFLWFTVYMPIAVLLLTEDFVAHS